MAFKNKEKAKEYYAKWRASEAGKEYTKKYQKEYYTKTRTPEKRREMHMKQRFGITMEQYARLYADQNFVCGICAGKQDTLAVDHDHKTGKVRGLLCNACNTGLGMFKDSEDFLSKAIKWITSHE